jgi:hypothetical protein
MKIELLFRKKITEILYKTLVKQAGLSVSKNGPDAMGGGKGILIQHDRVGALSTVNNQHLLSPR